MKTADTDISQKDNFFSRVMIKLSGEALLGSKEFGIDSDVVDKIALDVVNVAKSNKEVWFATSTNKTKLLNVPYGQNGMDLVVSHLKSDDGLEVLKYLESLL